MLQTVKVYVHVYVCDYVYEYHCNVLSGNLAYCAVHCYRVLARAKVGRLAGWFVRKKF